MKRIFTLLILSLVFVVTGCTKDNISGRIWSGELIRTEDRKSLSEVCLRLSGDTLQIYSNAVFGLGNDTLRCIRHQKERYTFVSADGTEFLMNFAWSGDPEKGVEFLEVTGPDYLIRLAPSVESDFTPEMLSFYKRQQVPLETSHYFSGRWSGEIIRVSDEKSLSPVCVDFVGDTLKVFANAIFGKRNESLIFDGYYDNAYHFSNDEGVFALSPDRSGNHLILTGDNFLLSLEPLVEEWDDAIAFYKAYDVSRNPNDYLFGSYYGEGVGRVPSASAMFYLYGLSPQLMDVKICVALDFLEGNRMRLTYDLRFMDPQMILLLSLTGAKASDAAIKDSKIYKYKIEDGMVRVAKGKPKESFRILPDGNLVLLGMKIEVAEYSDIVLYRR